MGRPVVHWELMSKDPAKVAAFYEKIFGWKIQHMPEMDYRLVEGRDLCWILRHQFPVNHGSTHDEGSSKGRGLLRENLRLENPAHAGNGLPSCRDRWRRRHQRRHLEAAASRTLDRQHDFLHRRG